MFAFVNTRGPSTEFRPANGWIDFSCHGSRVICDSPKVNEQIMATADKWINWGYRRVISGLFPIRHLQAVYTILSTCEQLAIERGKAKLGLWARRLASVQYGWATGKSCKNNRTFVTYLTFNKARRSSTISKSIVIELSQELPLSLSLSLSLNESFEPVQFGSSKSCYLV